MDVVDYLRRFGALPQTFFKYMRTAAGSSEMAVNGASTPVPFFVQSNPEEILHITRLLIYIQGSGVLTADSFGTISALTNGITLTHHRGALTHDLTDGTPIKTNGGIRQHCYDASDGAFGAGDKVWAGRWTFAAAGVPMVLKRGDRLEAIVRDDLSALTTVTYKLDGVFHIGQSLA